MYYMDFTDPKLNYKDIHLIIFWNRAFTQESCEKFFHQLHSSMVDDVLIIQSKHRLSYLMPVMKTLFEITDGGTCKINMIGCKGSDTVHLFKLSKIPHATKKLQSLDEPLINKAMLDFSPSKRLNKYTSIIASTYMGRTRSESDNSQMPKSKKRCLR